ncbi:MAG: cupin domain-containing protein [Marmoricola sp.]
MTEAAEARMGADLVDGAAWLQPLGSPEAGVRAARVRFAAGAATRWHQHEGGQDLTCVAGTAFVEERDGDTTFLAPGESTTSAAGIWHRHGATESHGATHVSLSRGETVWLR